MTKVQSFTLSARADETLQRAMEMAAKFPTAIRAEEAEALAVKATRVSPDLEGLKKAADRAYELFCGARQNGADIEVLRRLSARFNVIATLEEAARLTAQLHVAVSAELIDNRTAVEKIYSKLEMATA